MVVTELKIEVTIEITEQNIEDILNTALFGGIDYWCDFTEGRIKDFIEGGYMEFHTEEPFEEYHGEGKEWYRMNKNMLIQGIEKYLKDPDKPYQILSFDTSKGQTDTYSIDAGMVDAEVADMMVQYALFGELIYG